MRGLSSAFPQTGGVYVFLNDTISPAAGFLWAWAMFWSAHSGIIAASSVVFGRYLVSFAPRDDTGVRIAAQPARFTVFRSMSKKASALRDNPAPGHTRAQGFEGGLVGIAGLPNELRRAIPALPRE